MHKSRRDATNKECACREFAASLLRVSCMQLVRTLRQRQAHSNTQQVASTHLGEEDADHAVQHAAAPVEGEAAVAQHAPAGAKVQVAREPQRTKRWCLVVSASSWHAAAC